MTRKLILAALALVLVAALAGIASRAAADSGPEIQIAVTNDRQERTLDVTWHAVTGQFLTTWSEHPSHSVDGAETHHGDDTILARLVNLDGNPAGARFQVSSGGGSKDFPQVAHVGNTDGRGRAGCRRRGAAGKRDHAAALSRVVPAEDGDDHGARG